MPAAPPRRSCSAQANELGLTMVGVPEELGGAVEERSAVTSVLMSEALAQGDMGFAVAALAPAGVSTALSLWGDADQQATYLPEFVGENVPAATIALHEPRALFDPFTLQTTARRAGDGYVLDGVKSLVPRAGDAELMIVAAEPRGPGPGAVRGRVQDPGHHRHALSRRWESAPPRPAGWSSKRSRCRRGRCSATATPTSTARASSSAGWPGARSRSAPARPCSTT